MKQLPHQLFAQYVAAAVFLAAVIGKMYAGGRFGSKTTGQNV
ncbi:hypothetical protein [Microbacterium pullorum]|nr:hypothetical protein [Microbacterium pullorum]